MEYSKKEIMLFAFIYIFLALLMLFNMPQQSFSIPKLLLTPIVILLPIVIVYILLKHLLNWQKDQIVAEVIKELKKIDNEKNIKE
jgi:hypothetical protein